MELILYHDLSAIACTESGHIITVSANNGIVQAYDPRTKQFALLYASKRVFAPMWFIDHKRLLVGGGHGYVWRTALSPEYFSLAPCCDRDR